MIIDNKLTTNKSNNSAASSGCYLILNNQIFPVLRHNVTRIGRMLDNDLVIPNLQISRYHAEIHYYEGQYEIRDLGSSSGTYLNTKKISTSPLFSGDIILLASIPIMFVQDNQALEKKAHDQTQTLQGTAAINA